MCIHYGKVLPMPRRLCCDGPTRMCEYRWKAFHELAIDLLRSGPGRKFRAGPAGSAAAAGHEMERRAVAARGGAGANREKTDAPLLAERRPDGRLFELRRR